MAEKKKISFGTIIFYIIPIAAISAAIFFGYLFLKDYLQYKQAEDEYAEIDASYIKLSGDPVKDGETDDTARRDYFPELDIDFSGLKEKNSDFACVLYVPALEIKYPVVYSKDNEDYIKRTFEGSYNPSGCIFYDYLCEPDFRGYNTFLYGHNMKNGSMFGKLKKLQDMDISARDKYFYIYTEDKVRKYEIFSFYHTTVGSEAYSEIKDEKTYDSYTGYCLRNSYFKDDKSYIDFSLRPDLVTLSTCSGPSGGNERFVVHGALIAEK
ncbi:hypothetical protein UYO_2577 [Lachnospiraceae bacterium JC7]|nr:hypothetical protein UYO_2577 [Lachnospiraceae bacterium JC7]